MYQCKHCLYVHPIKMIIYNHIINECTKRITLPFDPNINYNSHYMSGYKDEKL